MGLADLLGGYGRQRVATLDQATTPTAPAPTPIAPIPTWAPPQQDQNQGPDKMMTLMALLQNQGGGGGGGGGSTVGTGTPSDTTDPWNADPNGYNPVTRHGVTLDAEAMRSLIEARRAGYNAFPFIGQGYRSIADSNALYAQRHDANGNLLPGVLPAAAGGHSMHNYGLAFDAGDLPQRIAAYLLANGWYNGASFGDAPHYSYYRKG